MSRLWLFVIAAFLLLITAWSWLIVVANRFAPETIPVPKTGKSH